MKKATANINEIVLEKSIEYVLASIVENRMVGKGSYISLRDNGYVLLAKDGTSIVLLHPARKQSPKAGSRSLNEQETTEFLNTLKTRDLARSWR